MTMKTYKDKLNLHEEVLCSVLRQGLIPAATKMAISGASQLKL